MSLSTVVQRGTIQRAVKYLRRVYYVHKEAEFADNAKRSRWISKQKLFQQSDGYGYKRFRFAHLEQNVSCRWFQCQTAGYSTNLHPQTAAATAPRRSDPDHPFETLRHSDRYSALLYKKSENFDHVKHEAVKRFLEISLESDPIAPVIDDMYKDVVDELVKSLSEISDDELVEVIAAWTNFPPPKSVKAEPHIIFLKSIDGECLQRALRRKKWKYHTNFIIADLWRTMGFAAMSVFHWQFVKQLFRKIDGLSLEELVRFCLCFSVSKSIPDTINLYPLEFNILRYMITDEPNRVDCNEVAIFCKALFKAKSSLTNKELLRRICETVVSHKDSISDSTLIPIIKTLRLGSHKRVEDDVSNLIDSLTPYIKSYSVVSCAFLAYLVTRCRIKNEEFLSEIVKRVDGNLDELTNLKLRDLDYLTAGLTMMNVKCPDFYEQVVQSVRDLYTNLETGKLEGDRDFWGSKYSRSTPKILNNLANAGIFPHDLTSMVLSEEFLSKYYGKRMYSYNFDILLLNENILREQTDYTQNCLSHKAVGYLTKTNMEWIEPNKRSVNPYQYVCRKITESFLEVVKDPSLYYVCNILPHHQTIEIVFCKNDGGELIPIKDELRTIEEHYPKLLPVTNSASGDKYFALLMYFWDDFVYKSDELLGHARRQQRQIERLGYTTIVVNFWEWTQQETSEKQKEYLQKLTQI